MAKKTYRALAHIELRQSPDKDDAKFEQWHRWKPGDVFEAPAHLKSIAGHAFPGEAIAAGYVEEVR